MTNAAIAADVFKSLDVKLDLTVKIALDLDIFVYIGTKRVLLLVGQVLDANVGIDVRRFKNFDRRGTPDTVDVSQTDLNTFFSW